MFTHTTSTGFGLALFAVIICHVGYVHPATYTVLLPRDDSAVSASNSRPVTVEIVNLPSQSAAAPVSATSDTLVSAASAKVEKVLRKPMRFSLNTDQDHQASSSHGVSRPQKGNPEARIDQQPDAIDYYKYLARLENEEKGGAVKEVREVNEESADDSKEHRSAPVGFHKGATKHEEKHESKGTDVTLDHHEARPLALIAHPSEGDNRSEEDTSDDSHESSSNDEHKHEVNEDRETSASEHKDNKGGHNGSYKKGGGKNHDEDHNDVHDKRGKKLYIGRHHHEDGDVGKHVKEGVNDEHHEDGGQKKADHHEDDYHGEHEHGEEGKKGADFKEEGEHSKGHSTSGEHNIHKKDEYEKKQEFYDESHEGGDNEKDGDFFHEDGFEKGGHEQGNHDTGAKHEEDFGKEKHHEHGAHHHKDIGHDNSHGEEKHHDHYEEGGKHDAHHGHKKWQAHGGHTKGHEDSKKGDSDGHGSNVKEVTTKGDTGKPDDSEAHGSKHQDYASGSSYSSYQSYSSNGKKGGQGASSKGDDNHSQGHSSGGSHRTSDYHEGQTGGSYTKAKGDQGEESSNRAERVDKKNTGSGATDQEKNRYMLVIVDDHNNANSQSAQRNSEQIK